MRIRQSERPSQEIIQGGSKSQCNPIAPMLEEIVRELTVNENHDWKLGSLRNKKQDP